MRRAANEVWALLEPVIVSMGYEFVGAQFGQSESGPTLRVFIDQEGGIVLEDCAAVSRQISAVLDVEDVIATAYALEVSSPGIDRPLFTVDQFKAHLGTMIRVKMNAQVGGRRNFKGTLISADVEEIVIEVDGIDYNLVIDEMESAQVLFS